MCHSYVCVLQCSIIIVCCSFFFFFAHSTVYELRISDWSSDVCSSDLSTTPMTVRSRDSDPEWLFCQGCSSEPRCSPRWSSNDGVTLSGVRCVCENAGCARQAASAKVIRARVLVCIAISVRGLVVWSGGRLSTAGPSTRTRAPSSEGGRVGKGWV